MSSWLQNSQEIKILNHVSKFSVASDTIVVSIMIPGHGPLWQVFRLKAPSARTKKVILNEFLYYICESWYEPFEKYSSQSPGWFKNLRTIKLYRYGHCEQYENLVWILTNLSVVTCCYIEEYWCLLFSIEALQHCLFRNMCEWFSIFRVHFEPFEKNDCHCPAVMEVLVLFTAFITWISWKIKNDWMMLHYFVCHLSVFYDVKDVY